MNFNEFRTFISEIEVPTQRMGIFNVTIDYDGKKYHFYRLKENYSDNDDLFGFGLNHHHTNCSEQPTKSSIFHDDEDVCIDIRRKDFISAENKTENEIILKMKDWNAVLTFN
jgi:hypothetical protein